MAGVVKDPSACLVAPKMIARHVSDDRRVGRDDDFLLPVLVLDREILTVDADDAGLDRGVGHSAARPQIPRPMPFAGTSHGLREDVNRNRLLTAVGLRHGGDTDVGIRLDIRE